MPGFRRPGNPEMKIGLTSRLQPDTPAILWRRSVTAGLAHEAGLIGAHRAPLQRGIDGGRAQFRHLAFGNVCLQVVNVFLLRWTTFWWDGNVFLPIWNTL